MAPWLYLDLLKNDSDQLFAATKEGGIILRVCMASATFCSRLERKAIEGSRLASFSQKSEKSARAVAINSTGADSQPFTHSQDYRSVTIRGNAFNLTGRQAQIIEILDEARTSGNPDISVALILERLETKNGRWQDTFKSNADAKKALIVIGRRKGTLRLNV